MCQSGKSCNGSRKANYDVRELVVVHRDVTLPVASPNNRCRLVAFITATPASSIVNCQRVEPRKPWMRARFTSIIFPHVLKINFFEGTYKLSTAFINVSYNFCVRCKHKPLIRWEDNSIPNSIFLVQ